MQNAVGQVSDLIWLNNQTTQNNRTASANHIHQIAHLERVLFDDAWTALSIEHWLSFTGHLAAVRLSPDGQLIGYALISQVFDSADLLRVGIAPDYQRQGIAQQLLTTVTLPAEAAICRKAIVRSARGQHSSACLIWQTWFSANSYQKKLLQKYRW